MVESRSWDEVRYSMKMRASVGGAEKLASGKTSGSTRSPRKKVGSPPAGIEHREHRKHHDKTMKIKALSRSAASAQAPGSSVARISRNLDPELHPFERAREYTRALNATKIERMFAQPLLGDFEPGHVDGVYSFAKDPNSYVETIEGAPSPTDTPFTAWITSLLDPATAWLKCGRLQLARRYGRVKHMRILSRAVVGHGIRN